MLLVRWDGTYCIKNITIEFDIQNSSFLKAWSAERYRYKSSRRPQRLMEQAEGKCILYTSNSVQNTLLTQVMHNQYNHAFCNLIWVLRSEGNLTPSDKKTPDPLACVKGSRHKTRHTFNVTKLHSKKNNVYTYFEWAWSVALHSNGPHVWYINLHSF